MGRVSMPATWTWICCRYQGDLAREDAFVPCSAEQEQAVLQRLPKLVENMGREFGEFIEKQHPTMGKAELSGLGVGTPTQ